MKKTFILLVGLLMFAKVSHSQEANPENNSLSITIAPSFIYNSHFVKPAAQTFLPTGVSLIKNFMGRKRASFSIGWHILYESFSTPGFISSDRGYTGPFKDISKIGVFGIPVRLNYLLANSNDKIKVYLNSQLENAIVIQHKEFNPEVGLDIYDRNKIGYNLFIGAGAEMNIKISTKLSFVFEPTAKYPIVGLLTQMGLFDFQFGLKYVLPKK